MSRWFLLPLLAFVGSASASAQPIDLSGGGPIEITSTGGLELHDTEKMAIAVGDARAVRGDVTVLADQLVARYRKKAPAPGAAPAPTPAAGADGTDPENGDNEVYRLEAHGHVRILTPTDEAVGDDAIYDMDQAVLVMTGRALKLTTPTQVMTARDTMEYWSQLHMAVGRGKAVVVTTDARRLAGDVLVAYTAPDDDKTNPAPKPVAAKPGTPGDPLADSGKLKRIDAFGNVEVRSPTDTVRGDRGIYITETGIARVVDNVRLTHNGNQINGGAADMNMKTGIARIVPVKGARVKGLLVPKDATEPGNSAPAKSAAK
jgi:lipopolysaccharide export system protein LptA